MQWGMQVPAFKMATKYLCLPDATQPASPGSSVTWPEHSSCRWGYCHPQPQRSSRHSLQPVSGQPQPPQGCVWIEVSSMPWQLFWLVLRTVACHHHHCVIYWSQGPSMPLLFTLFHWLPPVCTGWSQWSSGTRKEDKHKPALPFHTQQAASQSLSYQLHFSHRLSPSTSRQVASSGTKQDTDTQHAPASAPLGFLLRMQLLMLLLVPSCSLFSS